MLTRINKQLWLKCALVWVCTDSFVTKVKAAQEDSDVWQSSQLLLATPIPKSEIDRKPFVPLKIMESILLKSLNNPEQAKQLLSLQQSSGTKAVAATRGILTPTSSAPQTGVVNPDEVQRQLSRSVRRYFSKETKVDNLPAEMKSNLSLASLRKSSNQDNLVIINGRSDLRYGLVLTDIQPSEEHLRLAAVTPDLDYQMLAYAPKASLTYKVGPVYTDESNQRYSVNLPSTSQETFFRRSIRQAISLADFRSRVIPTGNPTLKRPLPPLSVSLQQVHGFYALEAKINGSVQKESLTHKVRLPLYGEVSYAEERNYDWELNKASLVNVLKVSDYSLNVDHFLLEKRYQLNFGTKRPGHLFELIAHVPETALDGDFWPQHRWEFRVETSF